MVASDDLFTQDFANHHSPTGYGRQQRQQAVMQAAENLAIVLHAGDRLTKALHLVLANAVTINADGTAEVHSGQRTTPFPQLKAAPVMMPSVARGSASIISPC